MRTTLKLTELIEEWILELDVMDNTKADYKRKINLWFRWLSSEGVDPRSPSHSHILKYKKYLTDEGKSKFTVNNYVTVVKLFYRYCYSKKYYEYIGEGVRSSFKHREHYKSPLTQEEATRLVRSINTETIIGKRDKLIIALMLTNGLRCCEVERMNIEDFDIVNGISIVRIQRKGRIDKKEIIAVPPLIEDLLVDYTFCRDFDSDSPLFVSHEYGRSGNRLARITISSIIKKRLKSIGIDRPDITAHSLRHTCGSLMVDNDVEVEVIKDILGHQDTKTTRIYIEMAQRRRLLEKSPSGIIAKLLTKSHKKKKLE